MKTTGNLLSINGRGIVVVVATLFVVGLGAASGGFFAGTLDSASAHNEVMTGFCEYDRCSGDRCKNSGREATNCNLHRGGVCGTTPCGEAGSFAVLATFPTAESVDHWMGYYLDGIPVLTEFTKSRDPYPRRVEALVTLTKMASEFNIRKHDRKAWSMILGTATQFTRFPLDYVEPELRIPVLLQAIELAAVLDDPFQKQSIRHLTSPDTVRLRLANDDLDVEVVVARARARS